MPCERWCFLAAGNRHLSSISVKAGTVLSNLEFLCVCVLSGSFLISCAGQYSAEHLTGTPGDLQSSLCSSLLWYYALEILLALVSQAPAPLWLSLPVPWPGYSLKGVHWGNYRVTSFVCSPMDHCPSLSGSQCLQNYCFIHFVCFSVVSGRRVNLILVTPSWLEVDVCHFLNLEISFYVSYRHHFSLMKFSPEHFPHFSLPSKAMRWPWCFKPLSLYFYKLIISYAFISLERPQAS